MSYSGKSISFLTWHSNFVVEINFPFLCTVSRQVDCGVVILYFNVYDFFATNFILKLLKINRKRVARYSRLFITVVKWTFFVLFFFRFDGNQIELNDKVKNEDKLWLVRHLERMRIMILEDLINVKVCPFRLLIVVTSMLLHP